MRKHTRTRRNKCDISKTLLQDFLSVSVGLVDVGQTDQRVDFIYQGTVEKIYLLFLYLLPASRCTLASSISPTDWLTVPPPPRPSSPRSVLTQIKVSHTSVSPGCCLSSPAGLSQPVRPLSRIVGVSLGPPPPPKKESCPSLAPSTRLRAARASVGVSQSLIISLQERWSAVRVDLKHLLLQELPMCCMTEGHVFGLVLWETRFSCFVLLWVFFPLQCLDNTKQQIPHTIKPILPILAAAKQQIRLQARNRTSAALPQRLNRVLALR